MKDSLLRTPLFVCLLAAAVLSETENKYLKLGGTLEVEPETKPIGGVLWKHGQNKAAEWDDGFGPGVDYYGTFKDRTDLNKTTGMLVIHRMDTPDLGIYSVEIDSQLQTKNYNPVFIKDVPKPTVDLKPLTCTSETISCKLVCGGDITGAGPKEVITYRWKKDGEWIPQQSAALLEIINNEAGKKVEKYSCEMTNPVSVKESDPIDNPFIPGESPVPISIIIIIVIVLLIVAIPVGLLFGVKCFEPLRQRVPNSARERLPGALKIWLFPEASAVTTTGYDKVGDKAGDGATADAEKGVTANTKDKDEDGATAGESNGAAANTTTDYANVGDIAEAEGTGGDNITETKVDLVKEGGK